MTRAATRLVARLGELGCWLATAESLTGGGVAAAVTAIPGASAVFRGGVVSYSTTAKADVLGVPPELLAQRGPVDEDVARAMAAGVVRLFPAEFAVSTTGVAGPDPHGGHPPGTIVIGWFAMGETGAERHVIGGDRVTVTRRTVQLALKIITKRAG